MDVATKDCTALSDAELVELADLCAENGNGYEVGFLSKQREEWVLVTHAREQNKLRGFAFSTLERIGGTPSLLVGVASFTRTNAAEQALKSIMRDLFRRAVLAFPDEDVLVGTRMAHAASFRGYLGLNDVVPRPGHKPSGEERAWGRRLAKRFGVDGQLDDRVFVVRGDANPAGMLDYSPRKPPRRPPSSPSCSRRSTAHAETPSSLSAGRWRRTSPPGPSQSNFRSRRAQRRGTWRGSTARTTFEAWPCRTAASPQMR